MRKITTRLNFKKLWIKAAKWIHQLCRSWSFQRRSHYFSLDDVVQLLSPIGRDVLPTEKSPSIELLGSPNWCWSVGTRAVSPLSLKMEEIESNGFFQWVFKDWCLKLLQNRAQIDERFFDAWFFAKEIHLSYWKLLISRKHSMNTHLASHFTCSHCKSSLLLVHVERSHGEPSSMGASPPSLGGGRGSHQKKNALRWDIVEYLERAESGGFFSICWKLYTLPSHQERLKRSTASENFPSKTRNTTTCHDSLQEGGSRLKRNEAHSLDRLTLAPCTLLMKPPTWLSWSVIFSARVSPRSDAHVPSKSSRSKVGHLKLFWHFGS